MREVAQRLQGDGVAWQQGVRLLLHHHPEVRGVLQQVDQAPTRLSRRGFMAQAGDLQQHQHLGRSVPHRAAGGPARRSRHRHTWGWRAGGKTFHPREPQEREDDGAPLRMPGHTGPVSISCARSRSYPAV